MEIKKRILEASNWLLYSGIQNISGEHSGGINSYYITNEARYPYIYSEITGYGISTFLYLKKFLNDKIFLDRAVLASQWIIQHALLPHGGVRTRQYYGQNGTIYNFETDNAFAFDTGMVLYGFSQLYKETKNKQLLGPINNMTNFLLAMQRDDGLFNAYMDKKLNKITGLDKWSNRPSPFHSKIALPLAEAYGILHKPQLKEAAIRACEQSLKLVKNGRFITSAGEMSETHPSCYSAEGLTYLGIEFKRDDFLEKAAESVSIILHKFNGKMPCAFNDRYENNNMRLDTVAQALRLGVILASIGMKTDSKKFQMLYDTLTSYQVASGPQRGGFLYGNDADGTELAHPNSWVTMFAIQAMIMYQDYLDNKKIEIKPFV